VRGALIVAARRTVVAPRGGGLATFEVADLGAAAIGAALADADIATDAVDLAVFGNALYGGGNPARVAALAAGLPERTVAFSVDSQCCAGLDAIGLAALYVEAGRADIAVAGGLESFSRAPIRQRRSLKPGEPPVTYQRPPFTPWPERDPDMLGAAAVLGELLAISRAEQERYAIASHDRARKAASRLGHEIVTVGGVAVDSFTRRLSEAVCARLPLLSGHAATGLSAATVAVEADAAAAVVIVAEPLAERLGLSSHAVRCLGSRALGGDPEQPALAPIAASLMLIAELGLEASDIAVAEVMEAFAVQAMACIDGIGFDPATVNRGGGGLARGHPIGASGAILVVRLFHELQALASDSVGLATIAAAGGLGSAVALRR
jgi:acetyl-CoA C-acetyltransferase